MGMIVTLINGNTPDNKPFDDFIEKVLSQAAAEEVFRFNLDEMDIRSCIGCWDCWIKTPGLCVHNDDMQQVYPKVMESDLLLFCSPLVAGFPSFRVKMLMDRLIPLVHPYILLYHNECHHRKRYEKYPDLGFILQKEKETTANDLKILEDMFTRLSLNFHADVKFIRSMDHHTSESIAHEISSI